jgi:hypothetical protein
MRSPRSRRWNALRDVSSFRTAGLTGQCHDYKRNGTSTLFAAFEVAAGKVITSHKTGRRRVEFLDFMNDIVAAHPDSAIHVVLNNPPGLKLA